MGKISISINRRKLNKYSFSTIEMPANGLTIPYIKISKSLVSTLNSKSRDTTYILFIIVSFTSAKLLFRTALFLPLNQNKCVPCLIPRSEFMVVPPIFTGDMSLDP